jgi:hypothetical protein
MSNSKTPLRRFYEAFSAGDAKAMSDLYAKNAIFHDPAFGNLNGENISAMWHMLISASGGYIQISFEILEENTHSGFVNWTAHYIFKPTGRKITNHIKARFELVDGLIVTHYDNFSVWKWSRQALGWKGWLLGWTSFFRKRLQNKSKKMLAKYKSQNL